MKLKLIFSIETIAKLAFKAKFLAICLTGIVFCSCSDKSVPLAFEMPPVPVQTALVEVREAQLSLGKKENVLLIPIRAVRTNQDGAYVFSVKEDNTVELRLIKLGPAEKGHVVVEEGLEGVVKVVIEGQLRLFPGSKIQEVPIP